MDRGDLVPDEVIIGVIAERIDGQRGRATASSSTASRAPCRQAEALDAKLDELGRELTAAILIEVPDEEVVRRLGGRRTCVKDGHIFHVEFDPPKNEGVCDVCGARLVIRDDDKPEVIRNRLEHLPREDRAAGRLLRGAGHPAAGRRRTATPTRSRDRIRALLATLRWRKSS